MIANNFSLWIGVGVLALVVALWIWLKYALRPDPELIARAQSAAQIPVLLENINRLTELEKDLGSKLERLRSELVARDIKIAMLESDHNALEEQLAEHRLQHSLSRDQLDDARIYIQSLEDQISRSKIESATNKIAHQAQKEQIAQLSQNLGDVERELDSLRANNLTTKTINASLEAQIKAQQQKNIALQNDFERQSRNLELKLAEIMQKVVDNKLAKFDQSSLKGLEGLLKPFGENLERFRDRLETQQAQNIEKFVSLSKEIEQIGKIGLDLGKEAANLATALKGKKQMQGSWGEMILDTVLEYSGLLKGTHYYSQESYRGDNGKLKRPDVVVKLPHDRSIIIDSKVSLNDYSTYVNTDSDSVRAISSQAVVDAFRHHIDTLSAKDYAEYRSGTLQYVFMFVPIEGAFALAVQSDPTLYEYALRRDIAIVTPSTLTVSLRTIYLYWQSEQSSSSAIKLFEEAGKLYDKMNNFVKTFQKIGTQLNTLERTYHDAHTKLTEGKGNLLSRTEKLRELGARTKGRLQETIEFQSDHLTTDQIEIEPIPIDTTDQIE